MTPRSDDEVLRRWTQLFTGPVLGQRYLGSAPELLGQAEREANIKDTHVSLVGAKQAAGTG